MSYEVIPVRQVYDRPLRLLTVPYKAYKIETNEGYRIQAARPIDLDPMQERGILKEVWYVGAQDGERVVILELDLWSYRLVQLAIVNNPALKNHLNASIVRWSSMYFCASPTDEGDVGFDRVMMEKQLEKLCVPREELG